jgi:hypothetical protein
MTAVIRAARGGIGRRKLQAVIIGAVLLAATATSVVALGLLANANGPFDRASARQNGADVTAAVDPSAATQPQIAATTRLAGVTAAAGPYPGVLVTAQVTVPGVPGSSPDSLRLVGRSSPGGRVDDLTLDEGHWPDGGNQIVMDRGTGVFPGSTVTAGSQKLTVVGVADSVTGTADAWVLPSEVSALAGRQNPVQAQMLYRFASAGSTSAITADIAELRAALPRGALLNNPVSYLGARQSEQSNIAPWVPFIIAFGVIALLISVLIVVNDSASVTAYGRGNPAWSGYVLISGRWYSGGSGGSSPRASTAGGFGGSSAEADVNTPFLTDTGTSVGSAYTLGSGGHRVTVRIVGEVFDPGRNLDLFMSPATLAAIDPSTTGPQRYDVAVRPGISPPAYANAVSAALGRSYQAAYASGGQSRTLTAVLALIAMLTILIMVVAGVGVLNTVALQIRERAHDIGVFKSIGMTPRQTLAMVVCSVAFIGLAAGIVAIPAGVYLHHGVVPVMAHAANSGYPASLISVYATWQLILLALAGLVIAVAGALGPASWAAGTRTAFALRA